MTSKVRETYKEPAAEKRWVVVQCHFCQHSFGILNTLSDCSVCGGKGTISVAGHTETCPVCRDNSTRGFRFYCLHCQRTSVILLKEPALTEETLTAEQRNEPKG